MNDTLENVRDWGLGIIANSLAWSIAWIVVIGIKQYLNYPVAVLVGAVVGGGLAAFIQRSLNEVSRLSMRWAWSAAIGWALAWLMGIIGVAIGGALNSLNEHFIAMGEAQSFFRYETPLLAGGLMAAAFGGFVAGGLQWPALPGHVSGLALVIASATGWVIAWALTIVVSLSYLHQSGGQIGAYRLPVAILAGLAAGAVLGAVAGIPLLFRSSVDNSG